MYNQLQTLLVLVICLKVPMSCKRFGVLVLFFVLISSLASSQTPNYTDELENGDKDASMDGADIEAQLTLNGPILDETSEMRDDQDQPDDLVHGAGQSRLSDQGFPNVRELACDSPSCSLEDYKNVNKNKAKSGDGSSSSSDEKKKGVLSSPASSSTATAGTGRLVRHYRTSLPFRNTNGDGGHECCSCSSSSGAVGKHPSMITNSRSNSPNGLRIQNPKDDYPELDQVMKIIREKERLNPLQLAVALLTCLYGNSEVVAPKMKLALVVLISVGFQCVWAGILRGSHRAELLGYVLIIAAFYTLLANLMGLCPLALIPVSTFIATLVTLVMSFYQRPS